MPKASPGDPAPAVERILLVDASSLIFRAYYALPEITGRGGRPVHGVLGFLNMLFRLLDDLQPGYLTVCYDGGMSRREEAYPLYKANRGEAPADLLEQFLRVGEVLHALHIYTLFVPGVEADDLLATAARQAEEVGLAPRVVTGDKDLLQVVSPRSRVLFTRRGVTDLEAVTPESFHDRYHLEPGQFPDFKGLIGDKSDNLPGVRGIGEITAIQLLRQFGSLDAAVAGAATVAGRLGQNLREQAEQALLTRRLATLDRYVDLSIDLGAARFTYGRLDPAGVALLYELGLRALAGRLEKKGTVLPAGGDA
ncbi:MAG: 5'-3' exonuclease [Symbiobacteriia bacterium]